MNRIFRVKSDKGFTIIPNAVFNSGLSLRSIGLLTFILHLPDDWILYKSWLYDNMPNDGRDSINTAWNQLTTAGFIHIEKSKGGGRGKLPEINYKVYDKPVKCAESSVVENPATEKQHESAINNDNPVDFPLTGFPQRNIRLRKTRQLLNTNVLSTKEQNTNTNTGNTYVPSGTNAQTEEIEVVEKKKRVDVQIPDNTVESKKEYDRYFTEIVPIVDKMDQVSAKIKLAEYIQEKKPAFFEPYKALWNLSAEKNGLPKVMKLSDTRLRQFKTRIKDPDFDFVEVMKAIRKYPFLRGEGGRGWKVNWEYIFRNDTNYLKILEGQFQ